MTNEEMIEFFKMDPAKFVCIDDNAPPSHCKRCSNFMNWSHMGSGRWRCDNCGAQYEVPQQGTSNG